MKKHRQVAVHFTLGQTTPARYRIVIEGVGYGDAAEVKAKAAQEIRQALEGCPVSGAQEVYVTTLRNGNGRGNGHAHVIDEAEVVPRKMGRPRKNGSGSNLSRISPEMRAENTRGVWAKLSKGERTAEMIRRQATRYRWNDTELRVRLLEKGVATAARKRKWPERPHLWDAGRVTESEAVNPQ